MNVTLRQRKLKSGKISLHLDIYKDGKREVESLKLYLEDPAKTPVDRKKNKETLQYAEDVRATRLLELRNNHYGFKTEKSSGENDFLEFYLGLMKERQASKNNYDNWYGAYKYLKEYCRGSLKFKDINVEFLEGFKKFLHSTKIIDRQTKLSQNSIVSYFNKVRAAVNRAFELDLIHTNPVKKVLSVLPADPHRQYLTMEELKEIAKADCKYPILKNAFLFSCFTGLRWSDINNLKWNQIQKTDAGWQIDFRQQKTQGQEYLPIKESALVYLGERGNPEQKIFLGLKYSAHMNIEIRRWMLNAGITKDITFHCARHTHATLLLSGGTDIYTVSKMLGHRDLKTTQLYTKVIDQKKIDALKNIPDL